MLRRITLIAILACFVALPAGAGVIIGNISAGSTQVDGTGIGDGASKAAGWTMPSGTNYSLDSVTLDLRYGYYYTGLPAPVVTAAIYGNSGSGPTGSALVTLTDPSFVFSITADYNYVFTPPSAFTLSAGTTYWLVLSATDPSGSSGDEINWKMSSPLITPSGIATPAGYRFNSSGVVPPLGSSIYFNTFEVDGTALASSAPEPATMLLAAAGLSVVLLRRRQLRR